MYVQNVSLDALQFLYICNLFYLCNLIQKDNCIDYSDKEGKVAKEDAAEVDDKKEVFQKILRRRVGHLEKLLKGNWHGLDLLKRGCL